MRDIQIINPTNYQEWNKLVLANEDCSFFHTSHWARVLQESYHYKPLYFSILNNDRLLALIPVMEIRSCFTGRRGVSLPFSDYCEPITADEGHFQGLLNQILRYGQTSGWKYLELRDGKRFLPVAASSSYYYSHSLNLSQNPGEIFSRFRNSTKRNIRKAVKEGVEVKICHSLEALKEFYRLHSLTRKHHGIPPQPFYFFENIHDYVISQNQGIVVVASFNQRVVAAAVFFHFGHKAIYKYGASDRDCQHLRANNLVMWEAIKWYCQKSYRSFCFGRTETENKGLMQFKAGWGTKQETLRYSKHHLKKQSFVPALVKISGVHNKIFTRMPVPLLRLAGTLLYPHMG